MSIVGGKQLTKGLSCIHNKNGFTIAVLHYTADDRKTEQWADKLKRTYPSQDIWRQEMELDFTKASGRRMFPEFVSSVHISNLTAVPFRDIWRGWDFGYHHPACLWAQYDPIGSQLNILAELMGVDKVVNRFCEDVLRISRDLFPGYNFLDAGDPAVRARSDKSERTSADILRAQGIRIQTRPLLVKDGINTIRNLLLLKPGGTTSLKVDAKCSVLIDGFLGGYTRNEEDEPVKDGYYEHLFDALRYMVGVFYNPKTFQIIRPSFPWARKRVTVNLTSGY